MKKLSLITILLTVLMSMVETNIYASLPITVAIKNDDGIIINYRGDPDTKEMSVVNKQWNEAKYSGKVVIPKQVLYNGEYFSVTSIADNAFQECKDLTSVSIPYSVKTIGDWAFDDCSSLTEIGLDEYGLTSIGRYAFSDCISLTSVMIPNTVTTIGISAFYDCKALTSVWISPNSPLTTLDERVFSRCESLTSFTIPNNVTSIGESAFYGSGLTSVWIPNSVTSIGNDAFNSCKSLTTVTIPNSVTSIGNDAFRSCKSLTTVTIPNSVTSIGEYAFSNCELTSITIPNSVTSIGEYAFEYSHINSVTINTNAGILDNVFYRSEIKEVTIGEDAGDVSVSFKENSSLTKVYINCPEFNSTCFYENKYIKEVIIGDNVKKIGSHVFERCGGITSVTIGNNVEEIEDEAFSICTSLTSVTIPNSVTDIWRRAFYFCTSLKSVEFGSGLEYIGQEAFDYCPLSTITIGKSIKRIFGLAFAGNSKLKDVYCLAEKLWSSEDNEGLYTDEWAFGGCEEDATLHVPASAINLYRTTEPWSRFRNIVELDKLPDDDTAISGTCGDGVNFSYNKATKTLTISGNGEMADYEYGQNEAPWFSYANEIQKIEIESGITSIGHFTFYKCSNVTSLSIPATVGYIGSSAFEDCTSLTSLSLNEGLLSIGGSAFENCTGLQTLSIPSTVNAISINAFKNCKGITDVYCYAETVPETHSDAFDATLTEKSALHVPAIAIEAYKATAPWSSFKSIVPIGEDDPSLNPDGETNGSCGEGVNYSYDKATHTLTISGSGEMTDYEYGQNEAPWFSYANEIQKIEIESGITSIGHFTFYKCNNVTSLSIPATVGYIGSSAFEDCTSLTSLSLNEGLLSIGGSAFENCTGLQTLSIPSTVNAISINAFKNCKGITDVYCYAETVPETHSDAFDATPTEKSTLHVSSNAVEAYRASWPWSDFKEIVPLNEDPDGIIGIKQSDDFKTVYSIKGEKLLYPAQGINIIKMKDGTIKKVFVKY